VIRYLWVSINPDDHIEAWGSNARYHLRKLHNDATRTNPRSGGRSPWRSTHALAVHDQLNWPDPDRVREINDRRYAQS
jgi:hypothetical protein